MLEDRGGKVMAEQKKEELLVRERYFDSIFQYDAGAIRSRFLIALRDENKIPKVPIYIDSPMATNATSIFRVHQECYDEETREAFLQHHKNPFGFSELHYITNVE